MRWYTAQLLSLSDTGETDEMNNPVCEMAPTGELALVRVAPWVRSHDSTEGNRFDMVERTFLTKSPASAFVGVCAMHVRGATYMVDHVMNDASNTAVRVRRCDKNWASD